MKKNGEEFGSLQFNATKTKTPIEEANLIEKQTKPVIFSKVPKISAVKNVIVPQTPISPATTSAKNSETTQNPTAQVLKSTKLSQGSSLNKQPSATNLVSTKSAPLFQPSSKNANIPNVKNVNVLAPHIPTQNVKNTQGNLSSIKSDSDNKELKEYNLNAQRTKHHHLHHHPQTIIEDEDDTSEESNEKIRSNPPTIDQNIRSALEVLENAHKNKNNAIPTAVELHTLGDKSNRSSNAPSLNEFPIVKSKIRRVATGVDLPSHMCSRPSSPNFRRENSVRSLRGPYYSEKLGSECGDTNISKAFSDMGTIRSWASVGLGSTDGKKMIIRRVPTSPEELFTIVNPPTFSGSVVKVQRRMPPKKVLYLKPHRKVERGDIIFPYLLPPEEYLYDDSDEEGQGDEDSSYSKPMRYQWSNKLQFVLACVGYSVGLGSVWRFPYLCYKSGGGVFLIPYIITMLVCGVPLLYMELAVGQYTGRGPIGALGTLCPLFKGTGLGSVVISFLMSTYYSVIIAYGIFYFFTSFKSKQPWVDCGHSWNSASCWVYRKSGNESSKPLISQTPSEEFFEIKVLQVGNGIEQFHELRWELVACLICAWILVYFAIWKSIKSSGRVRYFTATLPFILILLFLAKSLSLDGADKGLRYFFQPNWKLLGEAKVWVNAAAQTFNSMGIAFGSMISFASYNKYNNSILHDTVAVSVVNLVTSLLVGIFAFATIGNIATEHNRSVEDVIADGPGLIFVVYPQAIAQMPAANLWAILFFFMLLCLALNSQFATVEVVVTSIHDGFPVWIKKHLMCHEILVLVVCVVSLIFGLPYVTKSGIYFFQLMDHYTATISKMYLAFFEVVAIAWVYGGARLSRNVKTMTGKHPGWYFKFCWVIATPLMIISLWIFLLIDYAPPTYNNGFYQYPEWAIILGWIVASSSLLCIPIYMIYMFVKSPGESLLEKLRNSMKPEIEEKCPKCDDLECECIIEDVLKPMLVLQSSDEAGKKSEPYYIPIQTLDNYKNNGIPLNNLPNLDSNQEPDDPQSCAINLHVKTIPPSDTSVSSQDSKM